MIKFAFNESGRFIGRFTVDLPEGWGYLETEPLNLYKPVVNSDKTAWIEGATQVELDSKLKAEKEAKLKEDQEKIKKEKLEKIAIDAIHADPLANPNYWGEWFFKPEGYALNIKTWYKSKLFNNDVGGNVNAPDKGGWTEVK